MKKLLILVLISAAMMSGCSDNKPSFTINAEFSGVEDAEYIYLQIVKDGDMVSIDSAQLLESKVNFQGALEGPQMVYLKIGDSRKAVNFFGENSMIEVVANADDLENAVITGSVVHDEFMAFKAYMTPIDQRNEQLRTEYREASMNGETQKIEELRAESENIYNDQQKMIYSFLNDKKGSYIAPFVIRRYLVYELDVNGLDSLLQVLDPSIHNSLDYIVLSERVETLSKVAVGKTVVDFTLNDPHGNPISLSSFRGKVLLIDFWASWCGPCRRENPNVVKLYNDFKEDGFEILGVSFDEDHQKWIGAIEADALTWPHVSDLQGWGSAAGKIYGINSIPATVLVDREGVIIAKNLRGEALRKKLEELYAAEKQNT